jgi:hypothetical protein
VSRKYLLIVAASTAPQGTFTVPGKVFSSHDFWHILYANGFHDKALTWLQ